MEIKSTFDLSSTLSNRLNALILSREGTIPGSRGFGLKGNYLSRPPAQAINVFAIELQEKARIYFPEVSIKKVTGSISPDGDLDVEVEVT